MIAAAPDPGLVRFLRARVDERAVLNSEAGGVADGHAPPGRAAELLRAARSLPFSGGPVDASIGRSPKFAALQRLTAALRGVHPAALQGRRERTAFWINVYNALVIHAVVRFGVGGSIREAPGLFRRAAYQVGGLRFSLDDIEHGLPRLNRPLDPRVHFALNCGTHVYPPVAFYDAARLDSQAGGAARGYWRASLTGLFLPR